MLYSKIKELKINSHKKYTSLKERVAECGIEIIISELEEAFATILSNHLIKETKTGQRS